MHDGVDGGLIAGVHAGVRIEGGASSMWCTIPWSRCDEGTPRCEWSVDTCVNASEWRAHLGRDAIKVLPDTQV